MLIPYIDVLIAAKPSAEARRETAGARHIRVHPSMA
jgi:hypothetical protein